MLKLANYTLHGAHGAGQFRSDYVNTSCAQTRGNALSAPFTSFTVRACQYYTKRPCVCVRASVNFFISRITSWACFGFKCKECLFHLNMYVLYLPLGLQTCYHYVLCYEICVSCYCAPLSSPYVNFISRLTVLKGNMVIKRPET